VRHAERYPAWPVNTGSSLVETAVSVYRRIYGVEPEIGAVHAGLECGVIADKIGGMDMISIGPHLVEVHTPNERLHIGSVERTFELVVSVLKALGTSRKA
jgi:dipeptidase D